MAVTPAGRLVTAFGDIETMARQYAPDVAWSLPSSILAYPRPMIGKEVVTAFNRDVWTTHYGPDCTVEILDEVGDNVTSAVRFIYRARSNANGKLYENEYTVFVRSGPEGITEVHEAMDTVFLLDFLLGRQRGEAFAALSSASHE